MANNSTTAVTATTAGAAQKVFDSTVDGNDVSLLRLSVPADAPAAVSFKVNGLHTEFGEMQPGETDVFGLSEGHYGGFTEIYAYASSASSIVVRVLQKKAR